MHYQRFGTVVRARNVNEALPIALVYARDGVPRTSRGMEVVRIPGMFTTVYDRPEERVLFDEDRDANPFFHLMESMWILSGSRTVALPAYFLPRITAYSDDGRIFHGAYGWRLREAFGFDQIKCAIDTLRGNPETRQVVMSIWHPMLDLGKTSKDIPCNDMVMLEVDNGELNMLVCNRSNDLIWGTYGANVVQFSILQEFIAAAVGVKVGRYTQMSNNSHVYVDNPYWQKFLTGKAGNLYTGNPYDDGIPVIPLVDELIPLTDWVRLLTDCMVLNKAAEDGEILSAANLKSSYGRAILQPAIRAYDCYKRRELTGALKCLVDMPDCDWRLAMAQWLERRL